jgi:hypothetical protein
MRKKITAAGMAARQVFFLDNVNYKLTYSSLASALTRPTITDRILGVSRDVVLRLRWTWLATGNHLKYSDEIQRRVVPINLASMDENPHLRTGFLHELPRWAIENRHRLIWAVVVLVRRWLADGRPGPGEDVPRFGSFEAWRDTLGGILAVAGSTAFLRNLTGHAGEVSRERVLLGVFLRAAIAEFDTAWSESSDGYERGQFGTRGAAGLDVASELVPDVDPLSNEKKFNTQLGLWLSKNYNKPVSLGELGRWWYVPDGAHSKSGTSLYRLKKVD